jgi:pyruvate dehydrogenase E1 component alpha subunit
VARAPSNEKLVTMYRKMYLIRRFEERAGQQYGLRKIAGFCHLYIGQEAVAVGTNEACRPDDYMITGYREHGHALMRGAHPGMVMAELFGRDGGYSKGKGGSMHIIDIEHYFYGGYGIVGGQIPLATGMGWKARYCDEDRIAICFFGDAAANQGALHESFNMAAKWKLPVLYICENNRYGMGTAVNRVFALPDIYKRGEAYGMRSEQVNGQDVLQMYQTVADCAEHIRAGKGPVFLEALTYRFRGHSMADPATYRQKAEVEQEMRRDPILHLREHLLKKKVAKEEELTAIDEEIKRVVDDAVAFADGSPEPAMEEIWRDILVEEGEADVKPRERVLGEKVDHWPHTPSPDLRVSWEVESREPSSTKKAG